jgi:phosphatidylinositol dimannoside acyltransferase
VSSDPDGPAVRPRGGRLGAALRRQAGSVAASAHLLGWHTVRALPEPAAEALLAQVADLAWRRHGAGVRRLEANLRRVRPDLDDAGLRALSRAGMRSYLAYWCDAFRMPDWSRERLVGTVRAEGDAAVRATLVDGRGVVMALAHQGNWDHAGAWSALELARVTTVAERLRPERLFRAFTAFRESLGMEVLPLDAGAAVTSTLVRRLKAGGFVPLLADRDLTDAGVGVTLFGEQARMAAGPAALALMTGAALHPVSIWSEPLPAGAPARRGIVVHFHPEVVPPAQGSRRERVAALTQACADRLAEGIAAHPQDWHMLQPVFTADRPVATAAPVVTADRPVGAGRDAGSRGLRR